MATKRARDLQYLCSVYEVEFYFFILFIQLDIISLAYIDSIPRVYATHALSCKLNQDNAITTYIQGEPVLHTNTQRSKHTNTTQFAQTDRRTDGNRIQRTFTLCSTLCEGVDTDTPPAQHSHEPTTDTDTYTTTEPQAKRSRNKSITYAAVWPTTRSHNTRLYANLRTRHFKPCWAWRACEELW